MAAAGPGAPRPGQVAGAAQAVTASPSASVTVTVNGTRFSQVWPVRMTLAQLLRDELGLTGTKVSCDLQACGACSVLVDGEPVSSCTFLAADADGRQVQTVEGLAGASGPSDLQNAFMDNFALQCGFCTPGFLVTATAYLRDLTEPPDRREIVEALSGNLCRCTGYRGIVDAVEEVAQAGDAHAV